KLNARLRGLHVVDVHSMPAPLISDLSGSVGLPPYQEVLPLIETSLEERADIILKDFQERCERAGVKPTLCKAVGIIDETIIEEGKKTDWILLAQRGEHFHLAKGQIIGSTAEAVVRKSGKPVVVTPATFKEIESMALAYDGSVPADHALKLALWLSLETTWPITAIIITDDPALGASLQTKIESSVQAYQEERNLKIDCAIIVLSGDVDDQLLRYIREGAVELLVMGAYGHNRLREMFMGSTTSQIIRKSTIPVLLTR
ncbi:MAG: universal stress protein, partial [Smithellaceae bacterium]|nr:universal stress protein [Smithellaceae bacterium]